MIKLFSYVISNYDAQLDFFFIFFIFYFCNLVGMVSYNDNLFCMREKKVMSYVVVLSIDIELLTHVMFVFVLSIDIEFLTHVVLGFYMHNKI